MANNQFYGRDPFGNMDDIFNQLMGNMGGYNSENKRYLINGREVTPEEFAQYRQTGKLQEMLIIKKALLLLHLKKMVSWLNLE